MEVKTDTKEKFHVITVETNHLTANLTDELCKQLEQFLKDDIKNIVLNLSNVSDIENDGAESLVKTQQKFYDNSASFVICNLQPSVENFLDNKNLLELMNVTPTESEAWDIVQMEEIERELLGDEDN